MFRTWGYNPFLLLISLFCGSNPAYRSPLRCRALSSLHCPSVWLFRCLFYLYVPQGDIIKFSFGNPFAMSATLSTRLQVTSSMQILRKSVG